MVGATGSRDSAFGMLGSQGANQFMTQRSQSVQLDRLLRGQQRIESGLEDVRLCIEKLADQMRSIPSNGVGANLKPDNGCVETVEGLASPPALTSQLSLTASDSDGLETPLPQRQVSSRSRGRKRTVESDAMEVQTSGGMRSMTTRREDTGNFTSYYPHALFESLALAMSRSGYVHVQDLANRSVSRRASTQSLAAYELNHWHPTSHGFLIHPASTMCSIIDGVRAVFMLNDLVMVPYVLAFDYHLEGWLYILAILVASFWTVDLLMNFCTGYIDNGHVVMQRWPIAKQYVAGGSFAIDFLAVLMEVIDIVATTVQSDVGSSSFQFFKALRFVKVTRFVRIAAKLRAGLLARISTAITIFIQSHGLIGFEHGLHFASLILRLLFVTAWLGHIGTCLWYGMERGLTSDLGRSWHADNPYPDIDDYLLGLYWSVSTMFSGASHVHPQNDLEVFLSCVWLVMGAMFVTSITSTLAAVLIDARERKQDVNRKLKLLTLYMQQQQTPVLLAVAVQANFQKKLVMPKTLTEHDLPFFENIAPSMRAALRAQRYNDSFLLLPIVRMITAMEEGILQQLAFDASTVLVLKEGEEVFHARQEMAHASLLSSGVTRYSSPTVLHTITSHLSTGSLAVDTGMTPISQPPIHTSETMRSVKDGGWVSGPAWLCELALLLTWTTTGTLTAATDNCEFLAVSTDQFIKIVGSYPSVAAVVANYAVQLCDTLRNEAERVACTDIDPWIDHDVILSGMDFSLRSNLVSKPVLEVLRRQNRLRGRLQRKDLVALEEEVCTGKSHLGLGPEDSNTITRVVRLVVLLLTNSDGCVCVQLATCQRGDVRGKFCLPGTKMRGNESPDEALMRLKQTHLSSLASAIHIVDMDTKVEYSQSSRFNCLHTKYIKHVHRAELIGHLERDGNAPAVRILSERSRSSMQLRRDFAKNTQGSMKSDLTLTNEQGNQGSGSASFLRFRTRNATQIFSDLSDYMRGANSTDAGGPGHTSSILHQPFSTEEPHYSFAVQQSEAHDSDGDEAPAENKSNTSEQAIDATTMLRIYKWMDEAEFDALVGRRGEVEFEVSRLGAGLSQNHWSAMLGWRLRIPKEPVHRGSLAAIIEPVASAPSTVDVEETVLML